MAFDAIVIGSGFGGAVTACRLAEAGWHVLILERGRRWDKTNFPRRPDDDWLWDTERPERRPGWLELRLFPNMTVAQGAGVGGGSLVYANVSCEAPRHAFDVGWPQEIRYDELKPHYDRVKSFMNVRKVPDGQWTTRMRLMKEAATALGFANRFTPLELAITFDESWSYADFARGASASIERPNAHGAMQGTCVHLGNCDIGCDVNARNTLDLNYLFVAETRHHAEIRPLHLVTNIEPVAGGYRVYYDYISGGTRTPGSETAPLVIVAAGSLGSTELLLRCRDVTRTLPNLSDRLGKRWSSNGDFLTPAFHWGRDIEPTKGPTIASAIDFQDGSQNGRVFWIEDGGLPNLAASYIADKANDPTVGFKLQATLRAIQVFLRENEPFKHIMPWFAQGVDAGDGELRIVTGPDGATRLHLEWDITASRRIIDAIVDMHVQLAAAAGGLALVPLTWSLFRDLVTPHPLGGCTMGATPGTGVVDHRGEVFGYPKLYVADGAVVPRAIGVNPSRTIAALAERIAKMIVDEHGH
jgi:cholesterol oxidase